MKGRFVIRDNGKLFEYEEYNDIPQVFDHLIAFEPEFPPGPHTPEQHDEMGTLNNLLHELLQRERQLKI